MSHNETFTHGQRLAGAFLDVNASASMVLELLQQLRESDDAMDWRVESMAEHMALMVRRIGYVNQAAAHLACPGLMAAPEWATWMEEPKVTEADYPWPPQPDKAAGAGADTAATVAG